ncbi:MAG: uracil-DNA glycosylase [Elusimicrobia bacterium]|nr:uracil-DNA glycosylase [Elusimicrobiota bacterium]
MVSQFDLFDTSQNDIFSTSSYEKFRELLAASNCQKCALKNSRTHIVVDRGNPKAHILVIGEGPGENEDLQGRAFVGRAGQLMDRLVKEEMGLDTNQHFLIVNVVKCRPPENRTPRKEEAEACLPFLKKQIELVQPKIILLLGATALKHLAPSKKEFSMEKEVGKLFNLEAYPNIPFMVLFHPAYLLYDNRKEPIFRQHLQELKKWLLSQKLVLA